MCPGQTMGICLDENGVVGAVASIVEQELKHRKSKNDFYTYLDCVLCVVFCGVCLLCGGFFVFCSQRVMSE